MLRADRYEYPITRFTHSLSWMFSREEHMSFLMTKQRIFSVQRQNLQPTQPVRAITQRHAGKRALCSSGDPLIRHLTNATERMFWMHRGTLSPPMLE